MGRDSTTATLALQGMGLCRTSALLTVASLQGQLFLHGFSVFVEYVAQSLLFMKPDAPQEPFLYSLHILALITSFRSYT